LDEAADAIGIDAIDLRLNNILTDQDPVHTGAGLAYHIHTDEVLKAARESRLWKERQAAKKKAAKDQTAYGIGFALGVKSFGKNPGDAVVAGITMDPQGRLLLLTNSVDMGNGTTTTLPLSLVDILGRPADDVKIGATSEFDPLQLEGPKAKDEAHQQELAKNPFWVPYKAMSTAASAGAYHMRHAAREAAKVLMQWGLWPAACAILGLKPKDSVWDPQQMSWTPKGLVYKKMRPIAFASLARKAHDLGLVTGALVHGFYRTRWVRATFPVDGQSYSAEIDGLALRHGSGEFRAVARNMVDFPPFRTQMAGANRYTPYGVVLAVEVARDTGEVKVVDAETFLHCGPVTLGPIVHGQMEGGFAMGIGQALTEGFPRTDGGPGQGDWNLHRYRVPLAGDCALGKASFNILPPHPEDDPRGMAEVVFNPVPAAIVNAVAHATGRRLRRLPLTPDDVKAALT
jgi:CO/xanthine dehydrogenase Mo-binding subunit